MHSVLRRPIARICELWPLAGALKGTQHAARLDLQVLQQGA